jgi:hypothetical protein
MIHCADAYDSTFGLTVGSSHSKRTSLYKDLRDMFVKIAALLLRAEPEVDLGKDKLACCLM